MGANSAGLVPRRVAEFDGLRGLLALWVALSHAVCWCGFAGPAPHPFRSAWAAFVDAESAVEVFMILSGFAIAFLVNHWPEPYPVYLARRFRRIYPTFVVCLALGWATGRLMPAFLATASWADAPYFDWIRAYSESESAAPLAHAFGHATLLSGLIPRNVLPNATGTFLPPAWSVTLEWQFYLVAPLVLWLARSACGIILLTAVSFVGTRYASTWENPHLAFLPARLPLFLVGIATFQLFDRRSGPVSTAGVAAGASAAVIAGWNPLALATWVVVTGSILATGTDPAAGVMAGVRTVLLRPWAQWLGRISYPLYLVHWPVIVVCLALLVRLRPGTTRGEALAVVLVVGVPVILATAALLHRCIERPMMAVRTAPSGRPATP